MLEDLRRLQVDIAAAIGLLSRLEPVVKAWKCDAARGALEAQPGDDKPAAPDQPGVVAIAYGAPAVPAHGGNGAGELDAGIWRLLVCYPGR
jgi:hypothetical protein